MVTVVTKKYVAYVGTYTREKGVGIHIYDVINHNLVEKNVVPVHNPSDLCISKDGEILYSIADEGVVAYQIAKDGNLDYLNEQWTGGMRGCSLTVDSKRRLLFMAGQYDGTVTVVKLLPDGSLGDVTQTVYHKGLNVGIAERGSKPEVDCVRLTPDEKYLCAVDSGLDHTNIYEIDYEKGRLTSANIIRSYMESAPRKIIFRQDYQYAYILCQLKKCVDVYHVTNQDTVPEFEMIQSIPTVLKDDGKYCAASSIKLSPDGTTVICSNSGANSVAAFELNQETGLLKEICNMKISGSYPKTLGIYPDNLHFVSLNQETNELVTFKLNKQGHFFLMDGKPVQVENPNCILFKEL